MALEWTNVEVPIEGLAQSETIDNSGLREPLNGSFSTEGVFSKRDGLTEINGAMRSGSGDATHVYSVYDVGGDVVANDGTYSMLMCKDNDPTLNKWVGIGKAPLLLAHGELVTTQSGNLVADATASTYHTLYGFEIVFEIINLKLVCSVYSQDVPILFRKQVTVDGMNVGYANKAITGFGSPLIRCGFTDTRIWVVVALDTKRIALYSVVPSALDTAFVKVFEITDSVGLVINSYFDIGYMDNTAGNHFIAYAIDANNYAAQAFNVVTGLVAAKKRTWADTCPNSEPLCASYDGTSLYIFYSNSAAPRVLRGTVLNNDATLTVKTAPFDVYTAPTSSFINPGTSAVNSGTSIKLWFTIFQSQSFQYVRSIIVNDVGGLSSSALFVRNGMLASSMTLYSGSRYFFVCSFDAIGGYGIIFFVDESGAVIARLGAGDSYGSTANQAAVISSRIRVRHRAVLVAEFFLPILALARVNQVWFTPPNQIPSTEKLSSYIIGSGLLYQISKDSAFELGFHTYPFSVILSTADIGGTIPDTTTYTIKVQFSAYDQFNRLVKSTMSPPQEITTGAGGNTNTITMVCNNLPYYTYPSVTVTLFETAGRLTGTATMSASSPTTTITVEDPNVVTADAGDLFRYIPPSDITYSIEHNRRMWCVYAHESLWFSNTLVENLQAEFSDLQVLFPPTGGGKITGLASMDANLVIFREHATYLVNGEGPNRDGVGNFSPFVRISTDVGCRDSGSIMTTDLGVVFMSEKGLHLFDRSLTMQYIGGFLPTGGSPPINCIDYKDNTRELVLGTVGSFYSLAQLNNRWAKWVPGAGINFVSARSLRFISGQMYFAMHNGTSAINLHTQKGETLDGGDPFTFGHNTGWLKPLGDQGYSRCRRINVLLLPAEMVGTLKIDISYDYDVAVIQSITKDASTLPVSGNSLQLSIVPVRQKFSSVMVRVYDDNSGHVFDIKSITMNVGAKRGLNKLQAASDL